ncbi:hypothetical protein B0H67DRAFT_558415 [Lasiosphaeris hirsuta]|uniref:Uncharacterized protein n=1 Tax=Lasiosphaeris hirsuta TaxID=260670 RepID=A0AA39ZSR5_9PEZI|nr:hypothetical protein B0H67DRAFT_558415 [Lasiosphaeris hirsuta]
MPETSTTFRLRKHRPISSCLSQHQSGLRSPTPRLRTSLTKNEKRHIYFLETEDVIQGGCFYVGKSEWIATNLGDSNIAAHNDSKLAAGKAFGPSGGLVLYFQDVTGCLKEMTLDESGRPGQVSDISTASPAIGTNLVSTGRVAGQVSLPLCHMFQVRADPPAIDSKVENTEDVAPTSHIVADIRDESFILYFQATAGEVTSVTGWERMRVVQYDYQISCRCTIM